MENNYINRTRSSIKTILQKTCRITRFIMRPIFGLVHLIIIFFQKIIKLSKSILSLNPFKKIDFLATKHLESLSKLDPQDITPDQLSSDYEEYESAPHSLSELGVLSSIESHEDISSDLEHKPYDDGPPSSLMYQHYGTEQESYLCADYEEEDCSQNRHERLLDPILEPARDVPEEEQLRYMILKAAYRMGFCAKDDSAAPDASSMIKLMKQINIIKNDPEAEDTILVALMMMGKEINRMFAKGNKNSIGIQQKEILLQKLSKEMKASAIECGKANPGLVLRTTTDFFSMLKKTAFFAGMQQYDTELLLSFVIANFRDLKMFFEQGQSS